MRLVIKQETGTRILIAAIFIYLLKIFSYVDQLLKVFIEFVSVLLLFYIFVFLTMMHVGSYLPDQGSNLHSQALEGEILTTGLPGKSHCNF